MVSACQTYSTLCNGPQYATYMHYNNYVYASTTIIFSRFSIQCHSEPTYCVHTKFCVKYLCAYKCRT